MEDRTTLLRQSVVAPLLFVAALVALWEVAQPWLGLSRMVLAPPSAIISTLFNHMSILGPHALVTMREAVLGFLLSATAGIVLGMAITMSQQLREALYPNIVLFQLMPKIALAPLFIIWFGVGSPSRLLFALFMAFFPITVATATGLMRASPDALRLCRSLTASNAQTFINVRFPFAIPSIFAGLKVGMTMTMIGIIVGEFVTAQEGLGYVIMFASSVGDAAILYSGLVLLCVVGLALYGLVALAEAAAQRWYGAPFSGSGF